MSETYCTDRQHKPLTRSCISKEKENTVVEPRDFLLHLQEPRTKRLRLEFDNDHTHIEKYLSPRTTMQEVRKCNIDDFILTDEDNLVLEHVNTNVLVHALLQMEGRSNAEDGSSIQTVPTFKEVMAWELPVVPKTDTVYLELIPGKPDTLDTLLYALSLLKELFVEKLGFKHVMVCGDGKTVNLLNKIKDEYGKEMSWVLIMLGTWHLLKDYLGVFLKKYFLS